MADRGLQGILCGRILKTKIRYDFLHSLDPQPTFDPRRPMSPVLDTKRTKQKQVIKTVRLVKLSSRSRKACPSLSQPLANVI